jgi:cytochrome P450
MVTTVHYPPGPKSKIPGGQMFAFRRNAIDLLTRLSRAYGDVVAYRLGPERVILLNHPDYIRDVFVTHQRNFTKSRGLQWAKFILGEGLLTSEGEVHVRQRQLAQPAFHRQRIPAYGATMVTYAQRLQQRWQDGETRDIDQEMTRLTLAIASKTLFDADVEEEAQDIGAALSTILTLFPRFMLPFSNLIGKLPLPSNRQAEQARKLLDTVMYRIIQERRASGVDTGDLLSMLLAARDEEGDGSGMSDQQLRDELMTMFLAGHETTATLLTWTWYLLSQHPAVEAQLHAELDTVLAGRLPTVQDMPQLRYTRMLLAEALRLYPPAWIIGRRALEAYEVGEYVLPAKAIVVMSPYITHHDARFFPAPEVCDPQRWTPEAEATRPKFAYFPFGGGARQCIGEGFAWMEGILALATLAQQWQMRLVPGHPVALKPLITLRPRYGMRMILARRQAP